MQRSLLLLALAPVVWGANSLVLAPGQGGEFTLPNTAAISALGSVRLDMRIHGWETVSASTDILGWEGGFGFYLESSGFVIRDWTDEFTSGQGNAASVKVSNRQDVLLRIQRDVARKLLTLEIWNADGSNYSSSTLLIDRVKAVDWRRAKGNMGGISTSLSLAHLRFSGTLRPLGDKPSITPDSELLAWEFENNSTVDTISRVNISFHSPRFIATPIYAPACDAGTTKTFRVGVPATLNGTGSFALDGFVGLAYRWEVISAPEPVSWTSDPSIASPSFVPGSFGTYQFQLTVTDSAAQNRSCRVKVGAVIASENDVIQFSDARLGTLFSPMLRLGKSPWPWSDDRNRYLADFFGALQAENRDVWNQPLSGTISASTESAAITGEGTQFRSELCAPNGTNTGNYIIVWYPTAEGGFGRWPAYVASCDSDTALTLGGPFPFASSSGLRYARMTQEEIGYWIGNASNTNFYDNVLAFYALYYRSGIDTYRDYARTLADRWWTQPWVDEGRTCRLDGTRSCLVPRNRSMTGLVVRALDGRPEMWDGLRKWIDSDRFLIVRPEVIGDIREQAYQLSNVALCALFDPDADHKAACAASVNASIDAVWAPQQKTDGYWVNPTWGFASWNGTPGTVNVTQGSPVVEGVNTQWTAAQFPKGLSFWVTKRPFDALDGDPVSYYATFMDATHVTLDRPYQGDSAAGSGWQNNNLVGPGTQPFVLGVLSNAFYFSYLATYDPRLARFVVDIAKWLQKEGFRPTVRGLYYGRYYVNCEPIREGLPGCADDNLVSSRAYSGEVLNAVSRGYDLSRDASLRDFGDNLFGAMFGKLGGPQSDGFYDTEIDDGGWTLQTRRAKDFGFLFGYGQGWSWPAIRLDSSPALPLVRRR